MAKIELTNDFHNTRAAVRPVPRGRYHYISRATANRLRRELCGRTGCTCGGEFGERGGGYLSVINQTYERGYIVDLSASHSV